MAARYVWALCRRSCSGTAAPSQPAELTRRQGLWERIRSGKIAVWTKSLLHDYGEACKDIVIGAKERPYKAAFYVSLLTGAGICASKVPSEDSFNSCLIEASSHLLLLSPFTRSKKSDQHVQHLLNLRNQGRLRHLDFVIFSVVYEAPYDPGYDLYPAHCPYLKPRSSHLLKRVLDVGFFGRWWLLNLKMEDFDVNEEDDLNLPSNLRTVTWKDLNSEENERLFQMKFQPVTMPKE
ncbi:hypothetical protein GDO86_006917 [Hymenochirus boettgeri]|uniref:Mitochondrial import inner membrane translocase subunit Tim29 n=1 Tax=Hymenochirus boettgeri TaxID=247094 RepID=A0A8T2J7Z0_9PIPI|nr:hypothetical protein GDO86_006917 [Hymenochirus boettgeri]